MIKDTLYAKYIKEREGHEILEDEYGFIAYLISNKECFIANMYVDQGQRGNGNGRDLIHALAEIAKSAGCEFLSATIHMNDKNCSQTLLAALLVGFEAVRAELGTIVIFKNIIGGQ